MKFRAIAIGLTLGWLAGDAWVVRAYADGGTLRAWDQQGRYEIAAFTSPSPIVAGPIDISVLILDSASGQPVDDAYVSVTLSALERPDNALVQAATSRAATNKLMYAALFDLPEPGTWVVAVAVEVKDQTVRIQFNMEAARGRPQWTSLWLWVGWPVPVVALFAIHQWLVWRKSSCLPRPAC